jgi:hypothetical protein
MISLAPRKVIVVIGPRADSPRGCAENSVVPSCNMLETAFRHSLDYGVPE